MKNLKKIAFGLLVGAMAIGFSAFTSASSNTVKVTRDAKGKILSVTSYFYNISGSATNKSASNFVYSTDPGAGCNSSVHECRAEWTTAAMPTNGQSPTAAGSPSYVGNGIETGLYNGQ